MVVVVHNGKIVRSIRLISATSLESDSDLLGRFLEHTLVHLGSRYPERILVWVREELVNFLDTAAVPFLVSHPLVLVSLRLSGDAFGNRLDYVDFSTSMKVKQGVRYPTWKMSATVGAGYGKLFAGIPSTSLHAGNPDYFFHQVGRQLQPFGLLCYNEPRLLTLTPAAPHIEEPLQSLGDQFRFVRSEIAVQWAVFLFFSMLIYERRFPFLPLFRSLFSSSGRWNKEYLDSIRPRVESSKRWQVDVVIPTLGREGYVLQLLDDLASQTSIPARIIIIEQEREVGLGSQMPFLTDRSWPFEIVHRFTVERGPCMARNVALDLIVSEWVFLADDDIRLIPTLIESVLNQMDSLQVRAATVSCLLENQEESMRDIHQTRIFGAGCSFVNKEVLDQVRFDSSYEFGYAEDSDFGAQIRNLGYDVVYIPRPSILHLKAPMGGFRTKVSFPWSNTYPLLKPSPTVMLFWKRHFSDYQFRGNKLMLFFKFFKKNGMKRPVSFWKEFRKNWEVSSSFAEKLSDKTLPLTTRVHD